MNTNLINKLFHTGQYEIKTGLLEFGKQKQNLIINKSVRYLQRQDQP